MNDSNRAVIIYDFLHNYPLSTRSRINWGRTRHKEYVTSMLTYGLETSSFCLVLITHMQDRYNRTPVAKH